MMLRGSALDLDSEAVALKQQCGGEECTTRSGSAPATGVLKKT